MQMSYGGVNPLPLKNDMLWGIVNYQVEHTALLLQGILHAFAGPIASISGYAQLLERAHPELANEFSVMARAIQKMENLLADHSKRCNVFMQERLKNIDINEMVSLELNYIEEDLKFNHSLTRQIEFDSELPKVQIKPKFFAIGFNLLMQTFLGRIRSYDVSSLEIQTYKHDDKVRLRIEVEGRCFHYQSDHKKIPEHMNGRCHIQITEPILNKLREIACLVFRQMGLYVQSGKTEKRETVLIDISY